MGAHGTRLLSVGPDPHTIGSLPMILPSIPVDFERNAIAIDAAVDESRVGAGSVVILGNDLQKTSYTIDSLEVTNEQTRLGFGDVLYVIGMGAVAATDREAGTVTSDRDPSGYGRIDGGRHEGRWLYNEDKSRGFRVASIDGRNFRLEEIDGDPEEIFSDADGDGRRLYWISDIGPGDTYRIPTATYHKR